MRVRFSLLTFLLATTLLVPISSCSSPSLPSLSPTLPSVTTVDIRYPNASSASSMALLPRNMPLFALGRYHTCFVLKHRYVNCWGKVAYLTEYKSHPKQYETPYLDTGLGFYDFGVHIKEISANWTFTCVLLRSGNVRCWGLNRNGQLGYGHTIEIHDNGKSIVAIQIDGPRPIKPNPRMVPHYATNIDLGGFASQISLGIEHACVLLESGKVRCWGSNGGGQLGYGHTNDIGDNETPASAGDVNVGGNVVQIGAGSAHTCALLDTGKVRCWGSNGAGQLGYGHTNNIGDNETPASAGDVNVGGNVVQIGFGHNHTCALLDTGKVRCWGGSVHGQLGYGNVFRIGDNETPASAGDVDVGGNVLQIKVGYDHTCALLDTGNFRCWGWNAFGQLRYGHTNDIGDNETPASAGEIPIEFNPDNIYRFGKPLLLASPSLSTQAWKYSALSRSIPCTKGNCALPHPNTTHDAKLAPMVRSPGLLLVMLVAKNTPLEEYR
jgi:alpha-tubulin suppressor-like RCC1 family protein